ncbi:MAG: host attachment protein [Gammaproteobacteria bacterium]
MSNVYVVVAESSRARVYQTNLHLQDLQEITDFSHPESRQHARDITADLPGRLAATGAGSHHAVQAKTDIKKHQADEFARQIAIYLQQALEQGKYDHLVLIAPPAFLGLLRQHLSKNVAASVRYELDKELLHASADELRAHLPKHL